MSKENVEIVWNAFDAYATGGIEAFLQFVPPDGVWDWSNSRGLFPRVFRGHDEIRAFMEEFQDIFEEIRFEIEDPIEVGDDVVIVNNVAYLRGRDGIETRAKSAWLITFREGKLTSLTLYQTKEEALKAAGLSE